MGWAQVNWTVSIELTQLGRDFAPFSNRAQQLGGPAWAGARPLWAGCGSGRPFRIHHEIGEVAQAIEVQPDRCQHPNIRPLIGTGGNGTGSLGDVARIKPLWVQQAR